MDIKLITALNANISIANYWLNEGAVQMSYSIYSVLKKLEPKITEKKMVNKIKDLKSDIMIFANQKNISAESLSENKTVIPEDYSVTLELSILWLTTQSILNLFNMGAYELGFMFLIEVSEEWHLLYELVIPAMKKNNIGEGMKYWSFMHVMFAADLYGKDHIKNLLEGD